MVAAIGSPAPDFTLYSQTRQPIALESLLGRKTLVVFIPFPFTKNCTGELCDLRDNMQQLNEMDANVVAITCDTVAANAHWAVEEEFDFPILSDFWPHGAATMAYGCFDDRIGCAKRSTYVLDEAGIVRDIIATDSLGTTRPIATYWESLSALDAATPG